MRYKIKIDRKALKELEKISKKQADQIDKKILALETEPRLPGCKKLSMSEDKYRLRVGKYRILYTIDDDVLVIEVIRIAHRKNAYR